MYFPELEITGALEREGYSRGASGTRGQWGVVDCEAFFVLCLPAYR